MSKPYFFELQDALDSITELSSINAKLQKEIDSLSAALSSPSTKEGCYSEDQAKLIFEAGREFEGEEIFLHITQRTAPDFEGFIKTVSPSCKGSKEEENKKL